MKKKPVHKRRTPQGMKKKDEDPKKERFMLRVYVSLIMIMLCLAVSRMESPEAVSLNQRLKTAVSESITLDEARKMGEAGIEKIEAFKDEAININK